MELDRPDRAAARTALAEAREIVDSEPVLPLFAHRLEVAEKRAWRGAVQLARRSGC